MKPFVPKDKQTHSTLTRPKLFAESERNVDHMSVYAPFKNSCHRTQTKWTVPCFFLWLFSVHHAHREWKKIRIRDSAARWRKLDDVIFERRTVYLLHQLAANWPHTFFAFIFEKNHSIFNRDHETFKDTKTTLVINESDTIIYPLTSRHTPMCRTRMRFGNDRLILPNTVGRNSSKTLFKSILSKILRQTHVSLTREPFFKSLSLSIFRTCVGSASTSKRFGSWEKYRWHVSSLFNR